MNFESNGRDPELPLDLNELKGLRSQGFAQRWLTYLNNLDRHYSSQIQSNDSTLLECTIFCIPAHMFNRIIVLVPIVLSVGIGAQKYDTMLTYNGYKAAGDNIDDEKKTSYGICFGLFFCIGLLLMILCVTLMKYAIKRERPKRRSDTTRLSDLRAKEAGTYSMPSGDAGAAAVFCLLVSVEMGMHSVWLLMPLVMLGRVYYQCHWIGDTVVGLIIGAFWASILVQHFDSFVPFFQKIAGDDAFIPLLNPANMAPNRLL